MALGFFLLVIGTAAWAQMAVPELTRRVTDLTQTLSADQVAALEARLAAFEAKRGSQIAVLIVPTTQPEDIAQFGIRVADAWKIGRKKVDDGVILIIAKNDRKLRIEVGYGLEGAIPDVVAKRIIEEIILPRIKAGDFYGAIDAGVTALIARVEGEPLPAPQVPPPAADDDGAIVFLLFGGLMAGLILSLMLGRIAGGLVAGAGTALIALMLGVGALAIGVGLMVFFAIAFGRPGGGGWSSGGGFGGLGGGGGSWGGGGGRFGGGGASGSW